MFSGKHKNRYVLVYSKVTLQIAARRVAEQLPKFRDRYRRRSRIKGLFRKCDVLTSLKQLKVHAPKVMSMSVYLKIAMHDVDKLPKFGKREKWKRGQAISPFTCSCQSTCTSLKQDDCSALATRFLPACLLVSS